MVIFTEERESNAKLDEMLRASPGKVATLTPAHVCVFVLFDKTVIGPEETRR
jgi:hypothetical protein